MQIEQVGERVKPGVALPRRRTLKVALDQLQAFSFTVPALVLLALFLLYPIGYVVYTSFQRWNLLGIPAFIGLENYHTIFLVDPTFLQSVGATFFWVVLAVPTQIALGLFMAVLIVDEFRGRTFFRTVFFLPMVISNGIMAMIMVVIMNTWRSAGFSMILYMAGLQSISHELYEAGQIDGIRNGWQKFRYISWPLLAPTTALLVITNTIGSFQAFDPFFVMTNGGPSGATTTIVFYIYNNFASRTGVASAAATIFLIIVLIITAIQLTLTRRQEARMY
jgi:multiple sugar transport system permease protein